MSPENGAKKNKNLKKPTNLPGTEDMQLYARFSAKLLNMLLGLVKGILFAHFPFK